MSGITPESKGKEFTHYLFHIFGAGKNAVHLCVFSFPGRVNWLTSRSPTQRVKNMKAEENVRDCSPF